jgi:hypothetical protein
MKAPIGRLFLGIAGRALGYSMLLLIVFSFFSSCKSVSRKPSPEPSPIPSPLIAPSPSPKTQAIVNAVVEKDLPSLIETGNDVMVSPKAKDMNIQAVLGSFVDIPMREIQYLMNCSGIREGTKLEPLNELVYHRLLRHEDFLNSWFKDYFKISGDPKNYYEVTVNRTFFGSLTAADIDRKKLLALAKSVANQTEGFGVIVALSVYSVSLKTLRSDSSSGKASGFGAYIDDRFYYTDKAEIDFSISIAHVSDFKLLLEYFDFLDKNGAKGVPPELLKRRFMDLEKGKEGLEGFAYRPSPLNLSGAFKLSETVY